MFYLKKAAPRHALVLWSSTLVLFAPAALLAQVGGAGGSPSVATPSGGGPGSAVPQSASGAAPLNNAASGVTTTLAPTGVTPASTPSKAYGTAGNAQFTNGQTAVPPLLTKIFQNALPKSETGKQKGEELTQAKEQKTQQTGSLLPNVRFLGNEMFQEASSNPLGNTISPPTQTAARVNLTQNLFRGASEYALYRKAGDFVNQKVLESAIETRRLYLDIAARFLGVSSFEKEAIRLKAELQLYDQQIGELRKRVSIGRSRSSDMLAVQAIKANLLAQEVANETARRNALQQLESLCGFSLQGETFSNKVFTFGPLPPIDHYYARLDGIPEIAVNRVRTAVVEEDIKAARGQHLPQLDAGGNYWLKRQGTLRDVDWDASINLTIPIYSGGVIQSQVREAASRYRSAQVQEDLTRRQTRDQIQNLYTIVQQGTAQISAIQNSVDLSQKTMQHLNSDYRLGLLTYLDVLTSMQNYQNALRTFDQFFDQLVLSRLQLEQISEPSTPGTLNTVTSR